MKKADRILSHDEFVEIGKDGNRHKSENFLLRYKTREEGTARVGITVSKKNGNAVTRNRIKRQIRAILDLYLEKTKPLDLVVVARYSYDPDRYKELEGELKDGLSAIGAKNIDQE